MTSLNTVLGAFTGPRRLRSALRRKTVAINSLLVALDGPAELRVRIPAAVFGGDIFGVMSSQLRDALVIPPRPAAVVSVPHRRYALASASNPVARHSQNFIPLADWLKQSTLPGELVDTHSGKVLWPTQNKTAQNPGVSFPGAQAARLRGIECSPLRFSAGEPPALPGSRSTTEFTASFATKQLSPMPALVSSLNRYWQTVCEGRNAKSSLPQPVTESPANTGSFPVTDSEPLTAPRAWPTSVGRDVAGKLHSFTNTTNPFPKPARLSSTPEHQIQNVFNIEVNHANQHSANFDDLGDRIAQILHEQALQHGIDVT